MIESPSLLRRPARRPRVSTGGWAMALYPFIVVSRAPDAVPQYRIALLAIALAMVTALLLPPARGWLRGRPEVFAVAGLLLVVVIGIPFSVWPGGTITFLINEYLKLVIFFGLLLYCIRSLRDVQALVLGMLGSAVYLTVGVLRTTEMQAGRPVVMTMYDANDVAFILVCAVPFAMLWAAYARGAARYLALGLTLVAILGIVKTGSRGGFVGLLVVGALAIAKMPRGRRAGALGLAAGAAIALALTASESYSKRIATIWNSSSVVEGEEGDYDASGLEGARMNVWENGFRLIQSHPLLGVGGGDFSVAEGELHFGLGKWSAPHNSFLQIAAELGLIGLSLFIYLLYRAIHNCRAAVRSHPPVLGVWLAAAVEVSVWGYVVAGSGLSMAYSPVVYLLVGMSIGLERTLRRERDAALVGEPA